MTYPNGSNIDNLVSIWNDVFLWGLSPVRIGDVFCQPQVEQGILLIEVTLVNDSATVKRVLLGGDISPWTNLAGSEVLNAPEPVWKLEAPVLTLSSASATIPPRGSSRITLKIAVTKELKMCSPDQPNLYGLILRLGTAEKRQVDVKYTRFGWRQFRIKDKRLQLNGEALQLWGDFGHPFAHS